MAKLNVPILVDWESIKCYMEMHDIVEVVRCRDCRHAQEDKLFGGYWCKGVQHTGDWFCADGKRREDDTN